MILDKLFSRMRTAPSPAQNAYLQIVAQARQNAFYTQAQVPDSVDGRFDMIVLHACLVMRRLAADKGSIAKEFSQELFDEMFLDMDRSLREMGVGDLSVGKKIKKMAQVFYGRAAAYEEGILQYADHPAVLEDAVMRNIFPATKDATGAKQIARYMVELAESLDKQPIEGLLTGDIEFPEPEASF